MIKSAIPVLPTTRSEASEDFYCRLLGFTKMFAYRPDETRLDPCYMGVARDGIWLHLDSFHAVNAGKGCIFLVVEDVDALHVELTARDVPIALAPYDQTWGNREMHVRDPDGNSIVFAQVR